MSWEKCWSSSKEDHTVVGLEVSHLLCLLENQTILIITVPNYTNCKAFGV